MSIWEYKNEKKMIEIDVHEPEDIVSWVGQSIPITVKSLNDQGWADYKWEGVDGPEQVERKQWGELLGGLDSVENQLRLEQQRHKDTRLILLVEGIATPTSPYTKDPLGKGTQVWREAKTGRSIIVPSRTYSISISMIYSWLDQVSKYLQVVHTSNGLGTAKMLVALYNSAQKTGHSTFKRHLNTMDFHPNPQVTMLMAIGHGLGIGPSKAELIIGKYGTLWNLLSASPEDVYQKTGVGVGLVTKLLRKVGRLDV